MTKAEFLKRCENAYNKGLVTPEILSLAAKWADGFMRLEGGQIEHFADIFIAERERTDRFAHSSTLANDELGYSVIKLFAILIHPCQTCAEDPEAWHTRAGFCPHKEK